MNRASGSRTISKADVLAILDQAKSRIDAGNVDQGTAELVRWLFAFRQEFGREALAQQVTPASLAHPIAALIHQDPYARRSFSKPRGYAGDAVLLDYFYGLKGPTAEDTNLGRIIFALSMNRPASESVRQRRSLLARRIDEAADAESSATVVSIACGHLREATMSKALAERRVGKIIAIDQDAESLAVLRAEAESHQWPVQLVGGTVRDILTRKLTCSGAAFVYAAGLYDYLEAPVAAALTARLFDMLKPGGRLLLGNFSTDVEECGYMEAFMDWHLLYKTEEQVRAFTNEISPGRIATTDLYRDSLRNVIYLELTKA